MKWSLFGHLAQVLAPVVINAINPKLSPIAGAIANGIAEAEQIPESKGPEKLQHVLNIADAAAATADTVSGRNVIDPLNFHLAVTQAVNTTVSILNLVHPQAQKNLVK